MALLLQRSQLTELRLGLLPLILDFSNTELSASLHSSAHCGSSLGAESFLTSTASL